MSGIIRINKKLNEVHILGCSKTKTLTLIRALMSVSMSVIIAHAHMSAHERELYSPTIEARAPTVQSLLSWNYVHLVDP